LKYYNLISKIVLQKLLRKEYQKIEIIIMKKGKKKKKKRGYKGIHKIQKKEKKRVDFLPYDDSWVDRIKCRTCQCKYSSPASNKSPIIVRLGSNIIQQNTVIKCYLS
jgi:hypothetical protein